MNRQLLVIIGLLLIFLGGIGVLILNELSEPEEDTELRILVVGNSFTYQNNLDQMIGNFIEVQTEGAMTVETAWIAFGGYRLFDHLSDVENVEEESELRKALLDGSVAERDWDLIVFQEQIEIPGLPTYLESQSSSVFAATSLGKMAFDTGSDVFILETWGNGFSPKDPENPYPEFPEMQNQISLETVLLAEGMLENDIPVKIVPAGDAFLIVFEDITSSGIDPYTAGSPFMQLFAEDQEHASVAGTYLAAAVIAAKYTNRPIENAAWNQPNVDDDFELYLRQVADRAVFGELPIR